MYIIAFSQGVSPIVITFVSMDIEDFTACGYDVLKVYDGSTTSDTELGAFCGTTIPADITSSGSSILIHLFSDPLTNGNGFRLTWSKFQLCHTTKVTTEGDGHTVGSDSDNMIICCLDTNTYKMETI